MALGLHMTKTGRTKTAPSGCQDPIALRASAPPRLFASKSFLANGPAYEGRSISVTGYYNHGFEHSALYASPGRDPFARTFADGIWINGISPFSDGNGQHIGVTGSFSEISKGHLAKWSGSICVTTVTLLERDAP